MKVQSQSQYNNGAIAAAGSAQTPTYDVSHARRVKWFITVSGANCTATPQFSLDGTNWFNGAAYAAGATGPQAVIDMPGPYVRLNVANGGAGAQSFTAQLLCEAS